MPKKILLFIVTLFPLVRIIKFVPTIPIEIYYSIFIIPIFILFFTKSDKKLKIRGSFLWFILIGLLSILFGNIPSEFSPFLRFTGFVLILSAVGPLFISKTMLNIQQQVFFFLNIGIVLVTLLSFIGFLVVPNLMLTERGELFGGITIQSMTLSPIAAISSLILMYQLSNNRKVLIRILCIIGIVISVFICLLAGSRSALISLAVSIIYYIKLFYKKKISYFIASAVMIITIVAISYPIWYPYTETIQNKMEYAEEHGSLTITREAKWKARLREFKASPILGCGFASVEKENAGVGGVVEPGNGWLFILSSMGIFAFIIFVTEFFKAIILSYKITNIKVYLLSSILVFLGIHMNAEGYSLSSGSFFFFYLWLVFGYLLNVISKNQKQLIPQR